MIRRNEPNPAPSAAPSTIRAGAPSATPAGASAVLPSRRALLRGAGVAAFLPWADALLAAAGSADAAAPTGTPAAAADTATAAPATAGAAGDAAPAAVRSVRFVPMPAPGLDAPDGMARTTVGSSVEVAYADGSQRRFALEYRPVFITGQQVPDGRGGQLVAGGYRDVHGRPIVDRSVPGHERQFFSDCPDGSSLLTLPDAKVDGVTGHPVFAVVQFEYTTRDLAGNPQYAALPCPVAVLTFDQNPTTGELKLVRYAPVDTAPAHGLWITCGASLSPWNTHLASEEYEPDAAAIDRNPQYHAFVRNFYGEDGKGTPYHYGHLPEVTVGPDGTGSVKKHYCLGRISRELVQVMPDERTVLMGDDATNGGLFLFIADRARDLSAGTLYVAKWHQTSGTGPGAATLSWIRLGHASSAEIEKLADTLKFGDIMDMDAAEPKSGGYTQIPFAGKRQWVRVRPGMEQAAAFLETHRFAALSGGSLGFTKMEGVTVDPRDRVAYLAMSYIQTSMLDGSGGIRVEGPRAGAVYALKLRGQQTDSHGEPIRSDWVPVDMQPPAALIGQDLATPDALGNTAHPDRIANPDNLKFSAALRTLFIGEDSGMHVNNFLWAWNADTGELARVLSTPAGAESTGLHAVDDIHGFTYVFSNFQHPGEWEKGLHDKVRGPLDPLVRSNYADRYGAAVGYLTGMPLGRRG